MYQSVLFNASKMYDIQPVPLLWSHLPHILPICTFLKLLTLSVENSGFDSGFGVKLGQIFVDEVSFNAVLSTASSFNASIVCAFLCFTVLNCYSMQYQTKAYLKNNPASN